MQAKFSSCLVMQANEAVRIGMPEDDCLINSKAELHKGEGGGDYWAARWTRGEAGGFERR